MLHDAGRLVKETTKTQAGTTTLQMQFEGLNRLVQKQVTHQGAGASAVASPLQTTRYLYDLAGRTTAISQTIGANPSTNNTLVTRYEWDARGRLVAKHLPRPWLASSSSGSGSGSAATTDFFASSNAGISQLYTYDLLDQITQIQYRQTTSSTINASAGNLIDQIDYTYDKAGQRISRKQQNSPVVPETPMQAQYNQANRLTQLTLYPNTAQAKTYLLDYDLEGNLIKKQNNTDTSCTQDCTEYVWDANNRLAQLKINGQTTAVYSYDAQGRRVEASISTSNNGTPQTNTVQYIYEGNQAIGEVRNGQLSHSLLTGLFIDEHLARTAIATNGQVQSQAQLTDALGSVIALANAQTSGINTSYNYSPYGQTQATGETSSSNQQYTGREAGVDGEAGLYYYRARYYDPVLKRFITEDPIGLEGGLNVYAYVEGDPVSFSDPTGLDPWFRDRDQNRPSPRWDPELHFEGFNRANNCYSYAMNRSGKSGGVFFGSPGYQPGEPSGKTYSSLSCQGIFNAARRDGAVSAGSGSCPAGFHKGRLFIRSHDWWNWNGDYHWYRQNGDGTWSHKQGSWSPENYGPNPPNSHYGYPTSCGDICLPN